MEGPFIVEEFEIEKLGVDGICNDWACTGRDRPIPYQAPTSQS